MRLISNYPSFTFFLLHYVSVLFLISFYVWYLLRYASAYFAPTKQFAQKSNRALFVLLGRKTLMDADPLDICRFLMSRDSSGVFYSGFSISGGCVQFFLLGNPATDIMLIKQYLKEVTAEQLQAQISPKQATTLFFKKILWICYHALWNNAFWWNHLHLRRVSLWQL